MKFLILNTHARTHVSDGGSFAAVVAVLQSNIWLALTSFLSEVSYYSLLDVFNLLLCCLHIGIRSFSPSEDKKIIICFNTPLTLIVGQNGAGKTVSSIN